MSSHAYHTLAAFVPALQAPGALGGAEGPDLTRYFLVCGALVVTTAVAAVAVKKLVAGNARLRAARRSLQIVDVLPVGGKQRVMVVRCYDRSFVLGVGAGEITPIAELDTQADLAAPAPPAPASEADTRKQAFLRALEQVRASLPGKEVRTKALPREPGAKASSERRAAKPIAKRATAGVETVAKPSGKREATGPEPAAKPARKKRRAAPKQPAGAAGVRHEAAPGSAPVAQRLRLEGVLG